MATPTNVIDLDGVRYALVRLELLEEHAPQLIHKPTGRIPEGDAIPWEVASRTLDEDAVTLLRAWREHLNLSQTDVAQRLGVSQAAVSKLERAKRLKRDTKKKLADALGVSAEQL